MPEVAIAPGLHELHRGVQVDAQGIGAHFVEEQADLRSGHGAGLGDADVAEDQGGRRDVAHAVGGRAAGADHHRPLAAEAEAVAALFGDGGKLAVDAARFLRAARHRRDHDRSSQRLAEEGDAGVDFVERELRQRVVHEPHALEQGGGLPEADCLFGAERDGRPCARRLSSWVGSVGRDRGGRHALRLVQRNVKRCGVAWESPVGPVDGRGRGP